MRLIALLTALLLSQAASADTLTVMSFNVESGKDTYAERVSEDIRAIAKGVDVWGLVEVADKSEANAYRAAAASWGGGKYRYILAKAGREDRLAILYNTDRLKLKGTEELDRLPGSRKPLVARFTLKGTKTQFLFMVNHLNRRDASRRQRQAKEIRKWIQRQKLPVIAVGDYNFDFDPKTGKGNTAFGIFTQGSVANWIKPRCVTAGNCPRTGTQCDSRYNSILDFVFAANSSWEGLSEVLFKERGYCRRDRKGYSDHRPVVARFNIGSGG